MEFFLPPDVTLLAFFLGALVTAVGGFVKGAVGFAQPLVMISGMGIFLPPHIVVAGIVVPIVVANLLQVARAGWIEALAALRDFRLYIAIVCCVILIAAQFLRIIPGQTLFLMLGIPVVVLCLIQLWGWRPIIPVALRTRFSVGVAIIAGILGGITGSWGTPTVLYLLAMNTAKERQMVAQGVIYGVGAIALMIGHLQSGVLNAETIPFSFALVVPSFLGMWLGFKLQDRLDQERFRRMTLIVLTIAGLNLVRKGIWG